MALYFILKKPYCRGSFSKAQNFLLPLTLAPSLLYSEDLHLCIRFCHFLKCSFRHTMISLSLSFQLQPKCYLLKRVFPYCFLYISLMCSMKTIFTVRVTDVVGFVHGGGLYLSLLECRLLVNRLSHTCLCHCSAQTGKGPADFRWYRLVISFYCWIVEQKISKWQLELKTDKGQLKTKKKKN